MLVMLLLVRENKKHFIKIPEDFGDHPSAKAIRVSPSVGMGDSPTNQKTGLFPPLFCTKNADFEIFMKLLRILPKLSPHKSTPFGKSCLFLTWFVNNSNQYRDVGQT